MTKPILLERAIYALAFRAEKDPVARALLARIMKAFFRAVAFERARGGKRLLDLARLGAVRFGAWRAPVLRRQLDLDTTDMADMGRLQDWEDRVFGVTGVWTEQSKTRATKCETACPYAEIASHAPEICTDVIHAMESATFQALNPRYRLVPLSRLLSKGDRECAFEHRLDES